MKKKLLSLALALVMCLGLTVPALAAEGDQPLTRADLALLVKQHVKPDPGLYPYSDGLPADCAGLPKATQDAILYAIEQRVMYGDSEGNFRPDSEVLKTGVIPILYNAFGMAAREKDPSLCTAPEMPPEGASQAERDAYNNAWDQWHKDTLLPLFPGSGAYYGEYLDVLYHMGILQSGTVVWNDPITKSQAEALFKAACAGGEAVQLGTPLNTAKPDDKPDPQPEPDPQPATPPVDPKPAGETANPTNDKLAVNGAEQSPTVYKIGGSNFFKIRDIAAMLNGTEKQFAVGYAGGKVTVTSGQPYEATGKELAGAPDSAKDASPSNDTVVINGGETSVTVYKIGGANYFKLRDLGKALDFYVGWEAGRGVYIETDKPYVG